MKEANLETSAQAETAFYSAFESADLDAMMAVWSTDDNIVCIHPHGPRLTGAVEIRDSWRQIMVNSPRMCFKVDELNSVRSEGLAIHLVNEHIHVGSSVAQEFTILATNVYRRTSEGWRIILHHASPTPESIRNIIDSSETDSSGDFTVH
jgi:ketosteroid isomerase-like protein